MCAQCEQCRKQDARIASRSVRGGQGERFKDYYEKVLVTVIMRRLYASETVNQLTRISSMQVLCTGVGGGTVDVEWRKGAGTF